MTMDGARGFVSDRIVGKIRYQNMGAPRERDAFVAVYSQALKLDEPPRTRQSYVSDVLAERLVRKWLRDGWLEVVARGRYRRASR